MADIIQLRRDTAANWTSVNPILAQGEIGLETDTLKGKAGDGSTDWNTLLYIFDSNALFADQTANLSVGYTTDVEVLASSPSITPDMQAEWIKEMAVNSNLTIHNPIDGEQGGCVIKLLTNSGGPYTISLDTFVYPVPASGLEDLEPSAGYKMTIIKYDEFATTVELVRFL